MTRCMRARLNAWMQSQLDPSHRLDACVHKVPIQAQAVGITRHLWGSQKGTKVWELASVRRRGVKANRVSDWRVPPGGAGPHSNRIRVLAGERNGCQHLLLSPNPASFLVSAKKKFMWFIVLTKNQKLRERASALRPIRSGFKSVTCTSEHSMALLGTNDVIRHVLNTCG